MEDSGMPGFTIFGDFGNYLKRRGQGCKGKGCRVTGLQGYKAAGIFGNRFIYKNTTVIKDLTFVKSLSIVTIANSNS
jgi:hypothetical protein